LSNTQWTSSLTVHETAQAWRQAKRAIVLTHAKPDGDAVGSTLAVARTLALLGASTEIWYVGPMPRWGQVGANETTAQERSVVIGSTPCRVFEPGAAIAPGRCDEPDLIVVVDTGTWSQVQECKEWITQRQNRVIVIDHHVRGDADMAARRHLMTDAASCTEILAPVCVAALGLHGPSALPTEIAEPLYLGLATDTGWFRFESVKPRTQRLAGDLLDAGVDHTRLYRIIEQQDLLPRWQLLGRALVGLTSHRVSDGQGGVVALLRLRQEDFDATGADRNETGGFSDMLLSVSDVRAAGLLIEQAGEGGSTIVKVSMRSKPGPPQYAIDVNAAMATLGGGGHVRAAGAKIAGTMDQAVSRVLRALKAAE
jgi:phosphoesterase RecJ-like protein